MPKTYTVVNAKGKTVLEHGTKKQMVRKVWKQIRAGKMGYDDPQMSEETSFMDFKKFFRPSSVTERKVNVDSADKDEGKQEDAPKMEQPTTTTEPMEVTAPEAVAIENAVMEDAPAAYESVTEEVMEETVEEIPIVDLNDDLAEATNDIESIGKAYKQEFLDVWASGSSERDGAFAEQAREAGTDDKEVDAMVSATIDNASADALDEEFELDEPVFITDPKVTEAVNESLSAGAEQYNSVATEDLDESMSEPDVSDEIDDFDDADDSDHSDETGGAAGEPKKKDAATIAEEMIADGKLEQLLDEISDNKEFADELMVGVEIPATAAEANLASIEAFIANHKVDIIAPDAAAAIGADNAAEVDESTDVGEDAAEEIIVQEAVVVDQPDDSRYAFDFTDVEMPSMPVFASATENAERKAEIPTFDDIKEEDFMDMEDPSATKREGFEKTIGLGNADDTKTRFSGGLHPLYDNAGKEICVGDVMSVNSPRERIGTVIALGIDMFLTESDDTDQNGNKVIERWHVDGRREYYHFRADTLEDILADVQDSSISVESLSERFTDVISQMRLDRGIIATNHEIGEPSRRRKEPQFLS